MFGWKIVFLPPLLHGSIAAPYDPCYMHICVTLLIKLHDLFPIQPRLWLVWIFVRRQAVFFSPPGNSLPANSYFVADLPVTFPSLVHLHRGLLVKVKAREFRPYPGQAFFLAEIAHHKRGNIKLLRDLHVIKTGLVKFQRLLLPVTPGRRMAERDAYSRRFSFALLSRLMKRTQCRVNLVGGGAGQYGSCR